MTYAIHEFDTWPFQMAIERNGAEVVSIGRYAYSTKDTLSTVSKRPENIAQYAMIIGMVEKANRAEAAEARAAQNDALMAEAANTIAELRNERNKYHAAMLANEHVLNNCATAVLCYEMNSDTSMIQAIHRIGSERDTLRRQLAEAQTENERLHTELVKVNQQNAQMVINSIRDRP